MHTIDESAFLKREGALHLMADWEDVLFMHFRIPPATLRPHVPYELDLFDGSAWVSLVAFTMRNLRPANTGWLGRMLFRPFSEQRFLNVRTYVRHDGERGIHFIAEWISDWINARLGPLLYGLPYRFGRLRYRRQGSRFAGRVVDREGELEFEAAIKTENCETAPRSGRAEFLLERYAAFNSGGGRKRAFRVWHPAWRQAEAKLNVERDSLLRAAFPWWPAARPVGACWSPGFLDVRMGRPRRVESAAAAHSEEQFDREGLGRGIHQELFSCDSAGVRWTARQCRPCALRR